MIIILAVVYVWGDRYQSHFVGLVQLIPTLLSKINSDPYYVLYKRYTENVHKLKPATYVSQTKRLSG